MHEANLRKQEIDGQIQQFENMLKLLETVHEKKQFQNDEDFTEDDALMINDYDNELNDQNKLTQNEIKSKIEEAANTIELLINENLSLENVLNDISNGKMDVNELDLSNISTDNNITDETIDPSQLVDYTQFKMETDLLENFSFQKFQKCYITFSFPKLTQNQENSKNLYKYLKIELHDSHQNIVPFDLKEKIAPTLHYVRIYFVPQSAGIFRIRIIFNNNEVPNSPFHFVVLTENLHLTTTSSNSNSSLNYSASSFAMDGYNVKSDDSINSNLFKPPIKRSELEKTLNVETSPTTLYAGRGRLLRMKNQINQNESNRAITIDPVLAHKRKSPDNRFDSNNNLVINEEMMDAEETLLTTEGSSKLPKLGSIDGSMNKFAQNSLLFVNTGNNLNGLNVRNVSTVNILSNHLRRYANANGLVRLLDDKQIPPLKALFQRKFSNLNFPIGVKSCSIRNWLVVCDNGSNSIKIFEKSTGELLRQISDDPECGVKFRRPSAVLLNERKSEMYIKDDKEIFVFDLEQDCKLIRKFGAGILNKPYGLAYDENENVACIDADFKNPHIHLFNKETGHLIQSKPYHPVMKIFANAHVLNQKFGQQKILSSRIEPFEKSKVRFICSNQNSIYASDLGRSIVYKTDLNGEIEMAFGFPGKRKGEVNEPSGIFVDNDGQAILVGDSKNDRLQVIWIKSKVVFLN